MDPRDRADAVMKARLEAAEAKVREQGAELRRMAKALGERAEPELLTDEDGFARPPIRLGDLMGPDGNVFMVIGNIKSQMKQVRAHVEQAGGTYRVNPKAQAVVDHYKSRTYDETMDLIERYFNDLDDSIPEWRHQMMIRSRD